MPRRSGGGKFGFHSLANLASANCAGLQPADAPAAGELHCKHVGRATNPSTLDIRQSSPHCISSARWPKLPPRRDWKTAILITR
jgi:hypothetical protein